MLDRILLSIRTPDVALAKSNVGELDIMGLPVEEAEGAKALTNITVQSVQSPSMTHLVVNNTAPYLSDKRIRQAMMYAMDRQGDRRGDPPGRRRGRELPDLRPGLDGHSGGAEHLRLQRR